MAVLISFTGIPSIAQVSTFNEMQAAYLYNFAKYITWPDEKKSESFVIGVLGDTDILDDLKKVLNGKKVHGLEIELKIINSIEKLSDCKIIYVPKKNSRQLTSLKSGLSYKNTLIVSEGDLTKQGAMIGFVFEDGYLRFKLNKDALSAVGLKASEGLLRLAILL